MENLSTKEIINESAKRGCSVIHDTPIYAKQEQISIKFVREKIKARKENPDLAVAWDSTYPEGFDRHYHHIMQRVEADDENECIKFFVLVLVMIIFGFGLYKNW